MQGIEIFQAMLAPQEQEGWLPICAQSSSLHALFSGL